MKGFSVYFLSVIFLMCLAAGMAWGATWYVDPLGMDDGTHGAGPGVNAFKTVQYAINDARVVNGDLIIVAAGTYTENVNLNKGLTLQAGSSPVINGGGAGNCISIAANGVIIDGFELTNGYNGILGETKNSTIKNCTIHDNLNWVGSNGVGISLWGDNDNNTISNNNIYNNDRQGIFVGFSDDSKISTGNKILRNTIHDNGKYTLSNGPDASRYGIQLLIADENLVMGNTVYNHIEDPPGGWWFANGIYIDASRRNTVAGNNIHDNTHNVAIYDGTITGTRSASGNKIQANTLVDPGRWSVKTWCDARTTSVNLNVFKTATTTDKYVCNTSTTVPLNAQWNWFGGENPPEVGDFSGNVDYTNYFATNMTVSIQPSIYYLPQNGTVDVLVNALVPPGTSVRGTTVKLSWSNNASIPYQSGPVNGGFFTAKKADEQIEFFDSSPDPVTGSDVTIDQALMGGTTGAGNSSGDPPYVGTLFSIEFKGVSSGTSNLTLDPAQVRDLDNANITTVVQNASLVCDAAAPTVTNIVFDNTTLNTDQNGDGSDDYVKNTDNLTVTATVADADETLTATDIYANLSGFYGGSGHTADNPSTYSSGTATWTVTGVSCSPANSSIPVDMLAVDRAGNEGTGSRSITSDNTLPTSAINLTAKTVSPGGHQNVALNWTNGTDAHLKGTLIRYKGWGYPKYSGSAPAYPALPIDGDGSVSPAPVLQPANSVTHSVTERDIYSYTAFAVDWAGNYGTADATGSDRSSNYYLGDLGSGFGTIPGSGYDGLINFDDLGFFSLLYFRTGLTGTDAEADFGPTAANKTYAAGHRFGLPAPDDKINFEDLMIFAMNYGNVSPTKTSPPADGTRSHRFAVEMKAQMTGSENTKELLVTVHLSNDGKAVKGSSILMSYDATYLSVDGVSNGTLFGVAGQTALFFHKESEGKIQIDAAALGVDRSINYSGDIATIRFKVLKTGDYNISFSDVKLRDAANAELTPQYGTLTFASALPTTYDISQNYPNPFNPTTVITYQLPEQVQVDIGIYNALGEKVATLVSKIQDAGYYKVEWNGRNGYQQPLPSGVYFYKMVAGDYKSMRKMMLLK